MNKTNPVGIYFHDFASTEDLILTRKDLREMFFACVGSDGFACLTTAERRSIVETYRSLQAMLKSLHRLQMASTPSADIADPPNP